MFTIKCITDFGDESLQSAESVAFHPSVPDSAPYAGGMVIATGPRNEWTSGTIYVMNETGATISKYNLGSIAHSLQQHP